LLRVESAEETSGRIAGKGNCVASYEESGCEDGLGMHGELIKELNT